MTAKLNLDFDIEAFLLDTVRVLYHDKDFIQNNIDFEGRKKIIQILGYELNDWDVLKYIPEKRFKQIVAALGWRAFHNTLFTFETILNVPEEVLYCIVLYHYFTTYGKEALENLGISINIDTYFPKDLEPINVEEIISQIKSAKIDTHKLKTIKVIKNKNELWNVFKEFLKREKTVSADTAYFLEKNKDFIKSMLNKSSFMETSKFYNALSYSMRIKILTLFEDEDVIKEIFQRSVFEDYGFKKYIIRMITKGEMSAEFLATIKNVNFGILKPYSISKSFIRKVLHNDEIKFYNTELWRKARKYKRNNWKTYKKKRKALLDSSEYDYIINNGIKDVSEKKFKEILQHVNILPKNTILANYSNFLVKFLDSKNVSEEQFIDFTVKLIEDIPLIHKSRFYTYIANVLDNLECKNNCERIQKVNGKLIKIPPISKALYNHKEKTRKVLYEILYKLQQNIVSTIIKNLSSEIVDVFEKHRCKITLEANLNKEHKIYLTVPSSTKDVRILKEVPLKSIIDISKTFTTNNALLVGIHWFNNETKRVDLDLSCTIKKKNSNSIIHIAWNKKFSYKDDNVEIVFSGDITDAPEELGGAAELIKIVKLKDYINEEYELYFAAANFIFANRPKGAVAIVSSVDKQFDVSVSNNEKILLLNENIHKNVIYKRTLPFSDNPNMNSVSVVFCKLRIYENKVEYTPLEIYTNINIVSHYANKMPAIKAYRVEYDYIVNLFNELLKFSNVLCPQNEKASLILKDEDIIEIFNKACIRDIIN